MNSAPSAMWNATRPSEPRCRRATAITFVSVSTVSRLDFESMPESSHAVPCPVPVPSSRNRPPGFDAARTAKPDARVVPTDLKDLSVSQVPGAKVSFVGYEFEIPWTDLDESRTRSVPKDNPYMDGLVFRSGLHLIVSASPPRMLPNEFAREWKISPQKLESVFGRGAAQSDYSFLENLYEFTPDKMHGWVLSPSVHYREQMCSC